MDNERQLTAGLSVVVVLGATATGKTALSIKMAQECAGEIVSADSRYFYRGMDVGTAKPDANEQAGVPHHLIDIREPWEVYSLASFLDDAFAAVEEIGARERLPVVAGGTPQYLKAFLEGWRVPQVPPDEALRAELGREEARVLFERLAQVDAVSAERIGPHNKRRLIRALEIQQQTGRPMSEVAGQVAPPYRWLVIGLTQPRDVLYQRIDHRVADMYAAGWLAEVRSLVAQGVTAAMPSMSAHGYREALEVLQGVTSIEDAMERTRFMIHKYVRHQETWFRRFGTVRWLDSSEPAHTQAALDAVRGFLAEA